MNRGYFIVPNIGKRYKYFIEVKQYNPNVFQYEYFLLLSTDKFDNNCRTCRIDDYGRLKVKVKGEFADVLNDIKGNIDFNYKESTDTFDVWQVDI